MGVKNRLQDQFLLNLNIKNKSNKAGVTQYTGC